MKRLFLIFIILLFSLTSYTQNNVYVEHKSWKTENPNDWGSFHWKVMRTKEKVDGWYLYYVYFYSNSYFNNKTDNINYDKAITYIFNVNIIMDEYNNEIFYNKYNIRLNYVVCDYTLDTYSAYFWSSSKTNKFFISYDNASAFDKSQIK